MEVRASPPVPLSQVNGGTGVLARRRAYVVELRAPSPVPLF